MRVWGGGEVFMLSGVQDKAKKKITGDMNGIEA